MTTTAIAHSERQKSKPSTQKVVTEEILATLAASDDGVYAVDSQQRIIFWSEAAEELTGRRSEEVLGRFCYDVMLGGDYDGNPFCRRNCPTIVAARRGQPVPAYDLQAKTANGRTAWFNMSIIPIARRGASRTLAIHMFRDVTSRRRAELLAQATLATVSQFSESAGEASVEPQPYPAPSPTLTARELEVLRLLSHGLSTLQMAQRLGIAQATVRNHIDHVLAKLGAHRRLEAVVYATQHGLI